MVRFAEGRRVNLFDTAKSLVLTKPLGILDHGGGTVFEDDSSSVSISRSWLEQGAKRGLERQLQRLRFPDSHQPGWAFHFGAGLEISLV